MKEIVRNSHAWVTHGEEADQAMNTIETYGVSEVWKQPDGALHLLGKHPVYGVHDVIVVEEGDFYMERSSFRPKNGDMNAVRQWLIKKGAHRVKHNAD